MRKSIVAIATLNFGYYGSAFMENMDYIIHNIVQLQEASVDWSEGDGEL